MLRKEAGKTLKLSIPIIFGELAQMVLLDAVSLAAHQIAIGCASFTFLAVAELSSQ